MADLKLAPRNHAPPTEDRGPIMTADAVADVVFQGKVSGKWVKQKLAHRIGFKLGVPWLFYQKDAEAERDRLISQRKAAGQ